MKQLLAVSYTGLVILLLGPYLAAQPAETTTITIQLDPTGSALWIVESRLVLATEDDEKYFEEFQKDETLKNSKLAEFKEKMNLLLEQIKYSRQRSMGMTNFDIFLGVETTVTRTYGVIKFQFVWEGFAVLEGDKIIMGDVFEGGYYLSKNELLIVEFPEGYNLVTVAPPPDQEKKTHIMWEGPLNFSAGEPTITLEEEHLLHGKGLLTPVLLGLVFIPVLVIIVKLKARPAEELHEEEPKEQYVNDRKLIVDLIKRHGGTIPQKKLPILTGFSKAKVSILLNELKEEGIIRKKFKGRENLIALNENNDTL